MEQETKATRLFFVVSSITDNEEIFDTLEGAEAWYKELDPKDKPRIMISLVKNSWLEDITPNNSEADYRWNYDDLADTFYPVAKWDGWVHSE
jgi:hypothetical protein